MRTHGEYAEIRFQVKKFCIHNLAMEYQISDGFTSKMIYVNDMRELKEEITKFKGEQAYEPTK